MRAGPRVRRVPGLVACHLLAVSLAAQCTNPTQVPNQTISFGTHEFRDINALSASSVVIGGSADVMFVAGNCIQLLPGFRATAGTAGTTFHAWADPAPKNVSVAPSSGEGPSGSFTWTAASPSGYGHLSDMHTLINSSLTGVNGCYVVYQPGSNRLLPENDSSSGWLGGFAPGTPGSTAENGQCRINGGGSSVSGSGHQLVLTVAVEFKSSWAGAKNQFMIAFDNVGLNSEWQQMGTWTVPVPTVPQTVTFQPRWSFADG